MRDNRGKKHNWAQSGNIVCESNSILNYIDYSYLFDLMQFCFLLIFLILNLFSLSAFNF